MPSSGSATPSVESFLYQHFNKRHADSAFKHYKAALGKFSEGDWEGTLAKSGKFVEAITKALMLHCGLALGNPRQFSAGNGLRKLEPMTNYSDTVRLLIPRVAIPLYDMASNRGGRHDSHDVDANAMDAKYAVPAMSWILAEMVRFGSVGDPDAAAALIEELTAKQIPVFEDMDGRTYVNLNGLGAPDVAILLLYKKFPGRIDKDDLIEAVVRHGHKKKAAEMAVHRLSSYVDEQDQQLKLRANGRAKAEGILK